MALGVIENRMVKEKEWKSTSSTTPKVPPHHILVIVPLSTTLSGGKAGRKRVLKRAIRQAELSEQASSNLLEHPL